VATTTAIATVVLGGLQYQASRSEESAAGKALKESRTALDIARSMSERNNQLLKEQQRLRSQAAASFKLLFEDVCRGVEGNFDSRSRSCKLKNGYSIDYQPTEPP
jgi:hypothetical protein